MITVAVLTAVNPQTEAEEKIYLTSGKHFVFQNQHCLPLISGTFRTSTQIVNNSLTSTEVEFGFGSLSVINVSGVLDKYSTWAFDGREVRLYRVENENLHIPDDEPPTLVGKMGVPQFGTDAVEIPIFNLALVLDTPVIESYANGNVGQLPDPLGRRRPLDPSGASASCVWEGVEHQTLADEWVLEPVRLQLRQGGQPPAYPSSLGGVCSRGVGQAPRVFQHG